MEETTPQQPQVAQQPSNRFWLVVGGIAAGLAIEIGLTKLAGAVVGPVSGVDSPRVYGTIAIMAIGPGVLFLLRRTSRAHPVLAPLTGGLLTGTLIWFLLSLLSATSA